MALAVTPLDRKLRQAAVEFGYPEVTLLDIVTSRMIVEQGVVRRGNVLDVFVQSVLHQAGAL